MSKNKNKDKIFIFFYKVVEVTLAKEKEEDESDDVDWEAMGVTGKGKKPKTNSFRGKEIQKAELSWRLKTFKKSDIDSIEQYRENTMLHTAYGPYIIKDSFVEALQKIYKIN